MTHWHGRAKVGRPARTYIQQLYADTGCSLEDLSGTMDDRDGWRERAREIRASTVTRWWWEPELFYWWCHKFKEKQKSNQDSSERTCSLMGWVCHSGTFLQICSAPSATPFISRITNKLLLSSALFSHCQRTLLISHSHNSLNQLAPPVIYAGVNLPYFWR